MKSHGFALAIGLFLGASVLASAADNAGSALSVDGERITVSGRVTDEGGLPVAGAKVQVVVSRTYQSLPTTYVAPTEIAPVTSDGNGLFSVVVPKAPTVQVFAAHEAFGVQSRASADCRDAWHGYLWWGPPSAAPVNLVLRRGVVLRGRVTAEDGRPFNNSALFLVPEYMGSGPPRIQASTDADGQFTFERMVLCDFELVPRSLDQWNPRVAGEYLRIVQTPESWLATAKSDRALDLKVERYTLDPVTINLAALATKMVQVWWRWGANLEDGRGVQVDASGAVQIPLERGVKYELWVVAGSPEMIPPWSQGMARNFVITPSGPVKLTLTASP